MSASVRVSVRLLLAVALLLSVVSAVRPAEGRADTVLTGSPCDYDPTQCRAADIRLVNTGFVDPAYAMAPEHRTALQSLEATAVDTVIRRHGLAPNDTDRVRMRLWNRPEIRLEMLSEIVVAANEPAASRSSAEQGALAWFASVQQRRNVQVAQAAKAEYEKFAGATAYQAGQNPANSCAYVPPAPYAADYPGDGLRRWPPCYGIQPGPFDLGPRVPSADDFTRWGTAAVAGREFTADGTYLSSMLATYGVGLLSAASVVSTSVAALAALPAATTLALLETIAPFVVKTAVVASTTGPVLASQTSYIGAVVIEGSAAVASSSGGSAGAAGASAATVSFGAGAALGVAAVVVVALTLAITAILQVVDANSVGQTLKDNLVKAQTTAVDPVAAMNVPGGLALLVQAVEGVTLSNNLGVPDVGSYVPTPGGDTVLQVTGASGAPAGAQRTNRLRLLTPGTTSAYGAVTTTYSHGWWVDGNPDPTTRTAPSQALDAYLWDPDPVVSNGLSTPRPAFAYPARVTTVQQSGRLRFLVTQPSRPGNPTVGGSCADLQTDRCWITDVLPVLDPDSSSARPTVALVANRVDTFGVSGTTGVVQHTPATFVAQRNGVPYTTDSNGDPVTVTWTPAPCRPRVTCPEVRTGPSQTYTFTTEGSYTFTVTATDSLGASTSQTVTFDVANGAAVLGVDATAVSGTVAGPVTISGTATDGPLYRPDVTVDWGDGSAPTTTSAFGAWSAQHAYPAVGVYTATVTAFDGLLTSPARTVTVTIGNTVPSMTLNATGKTPTSWSNLQPGTQISVGGTVTDPDLGQGVTVSARWYDGAVDTIPVVRTSATQSFTLTHTVRRASGPNVLGTLVQVTANDSSGGTSDGSVGVAGSVVDLPPVVTNVRYDGGVAGATTTVTGTVTDANNPSPVLGVLWGDGTDDPAQLLGQAFPVAADGAFAATHTFAAPGTYTVTVIGNDGGPTGQIVRKTLTVYVFEQTRAIRYVTWKNPPVAGQTSTLEIGVDVPEAGNVHVTWGPGPTGEGYSDVALQPGYQVVTADHVFRQDWGGDLVSLYVTYGALGDGGTWSVPDAVAANPAPGLDDLPPIVGAPGTPVGLTLQYDDLGADVDTVAVDWGDGSTVQQSTLSQDDPNRALTHTYPTAGVYHPTVTLTDLVGNTVTKSTQALIGDNPPVLGTVTVAAAPEGSASTVSATATDPKGGATRLRVDWGDGVTTTSDPATSAAPFTVSHVYADDGRYAVSLVALDASGAGSAARTTTVAVRNVAPSVTATAPATVDEGSALTLTLAVSDPGSVDTGTASVDWGDGTSTTGLTWTATARSITAQHVYADDDPSGTTRDRKRISVVATDDAGAARPGSTAVTVVNVAPTATAALRDAAGRPLAAGAAVPAGSRVDAWVQVSDPGTADAHTAIVRWGDGATTTVPVNGGFVGVGHTYRTAGAFSWQVTVVDDDRGTVTTPRGALRTVAPAATASATAVALRSLASTAQAPGAAAALRTANRLLVGPAPAGSTSFLAALTAGDTARAVDLLGQATDRIRTATLLGAPAGTLGTDVALLARALVANAILAAPDQAAQVVGDATAALTAADTALAAGDLVGALTGDARALTLLTPPPA